MLQSAGTEFSSAQVSFLLSDRGRTALSDLSGVDLSPSNRLKLLENLRRDFQVDEAAALLTQLELRRQASLKFAAAPYLYFTPEALQQATAQPIGERRAHWIDEHASPGPILDLGCGIGGDLIALAKRREVIAFEMLPDRAALAQVNVNAIELDHRVEVRAENWVDAMMADRLPRAGAAFADPARRIGDRRLFGLDRMIPPISTLLELQLRVPALGVKVAPSVADEEIPAGSSVEFISHQGVCKEAILWFGPLADGFRRRAAVHTADGWHVLDSTGRESPVGAIRVGDFLHEPDPAVIRAGAFFELSERLAAHLLDPQIAYLLGPVSGSDSEAAPFVRSFLIDEIHPMSLKELNRRIRALGIGSVELKKRGLPIEPESLRSRLKLTPGGRAAVVIFTRRGNDRIMIIARRMD